MVCCDSDLVIVEVGGIPSGVLNAGVIDHVESCLKGIHSPIKTRKRVVNLVIECLQNLFHHYCPGPSGEYPKFSISRSGEVYRLESMNFLEEKNAKELGERLSLLKGRSGSDLKKLHIEALRIGPVTEKGGGLGLIDMAIRSGNRMKYQLTKVNMGLYKFVLRIEVTIS